MASLQMGAALRQIHELFDTGTIAGLADGQLLERYLTRRDESAFAALVGRHGPMVLGVCRAVLNDSPEVEDAFQATFLVLIRKAGTIRGRDAVGGWLHRVAHRVAVQAGLDRSRKHLHERGVADLSALDEIAEERANDEWRAPLHEEVARLPERFRLPVVLCYLEGKTHAQAAFELRWGEATLRRRLSGARDLLRSRLTQRGVAVSTGALAAALTREATAAVPTGWAESLARIAVGLRSGSIAAVHLAEMLVRGMFVVKLQGIATAALILIAVSMVAPHLVPAGLASAESSKGGRSPSAAPLVPSPPAPMAPPRPEQPDVAAEPEQTVTVSGRVLDPDGKPFAGAKIYSYRQFPRGDIFGAGPPAPDAISDADGHFRFQIADPGFLTLQIQATLSHPIVAALARGFGPGWTSFTTADEAKEVTLKLVRDDVPIVGRVLDLEGRPIQGVIIRPIGLNASPDENLASWEAAMAGAKDIYDPAMGMLPNILELLRWRNDLAVTTGADGRFRLTGIGRERVVSLWIEGPTIVTSFADIHARTRPGPTYRLAAAERQARVRHARLPRRDIRSRGSAHATDRGHSPRQGNRQAARGRLDPERSLCRQHHQRQRPRPDGQRRPGPIPPGGDASRRRKCDHGQPQARPCLTLAPAPKSPLDRGSEPATVDFALKRGVAIRGKVSDKATGRPVAGPRGVFYLFQQPLSRRCSSLTRGRSSHRQRWLLRIGGLTGSRSDRCSGREGFLSRRPGCRHDPRCRRARLVPD